LRVRFFGEHTGLFGAGKALINEHMRASFTRNHPQCCEPLDQGPENRNDQTWQPLYAASALRPIPSYEYQRYEPEIERYGGPQALQISEQHFAWSSAVALRVLEQEQEGSGSRHNAAFLLMQASAESFQLDSEQRATGFEQFYLRRRALAWQKPP